MSGGGPLEERLERLAQRGRLTAWWETIPTMLVFLRLETPGGTITAGRERLPAAIAEMERRLHLMPKEGLET